MSTVSSSPEPNQTQVTIGYGRLLQALFPGQTLTTEQASVLRSMLCSLHDAREALADVDDSDQYAFAAGVLESVLDRYVSELAQLGRCES